MEHLHEIDWEKQWADFAPHFRDGLSHVDLEAFGGPLLLLKPGAGFGDLSHPTTRLVLNLMAPHVKDKVIFDIGCGSGILSIAAALLGAKQAYGIDIDKGAVDHSRENAKINRVEAKTHFSSEVEPSWAPPEPFVIVMNMIEMEQKIAWRSADPLHSQNFLLVASGVLSSQREQYLQLAKSWGWCLKEEKQEEGWLGFVFVPRSQ